MSDGLHKGHRQRLMERFGKSPDHFYDHEILEALLFYALPRVDTNPLAHRLLQRFGNIQNVLNADEKSLCTVEGIGVQVATFLRLHGEIYRRIQQVKPQVQYLRNSRDSRIFVKERLDETTDEELLMMFLDGQGKVLSVSKYSNKKADQVESQILDVVQSAAALRAKAMVIAHNHPSGNPKPSVEDIASTKKLETFCEMCGIVLSDHVIIAGKNTFSFRDEGLINPSKTSKAKEIELWKK